MKRSKNNSWLLILMIISQVMLTGLLIQWLKSQWDDEKEVLTNEVSRQFNESINQVLDSLLVEHLITPVLNDSTSLTNNIKIFGKKKPEDTTAKNQHITAMYNGTGSDQQTVLTIAIPDTCSTEQKDRISFNIYDSSEKTFLLRSVKLIIDRTGDTAGEWNQISHMGSMMPDTSLLKDIFEKRLGEKRKGMMIKWISGAEKVALKSGGSGIFLKSNLFEVPFNAEITHFNKILLNNISAQILFAIVLLSLTGAAFFFTFRSLKKMEILNTLRNDFISNISHELKTPVSTVTIALEALKTYDGMNDRTKSDEYLDIAFNEMKRLDQLISQVLNTALLEDQNQYLSLEETDLVSLTKDVLDSMQIRIIQNDAKIEFRHTEEKYLLNLDKLHIQGVLYNLLDNSLKYNPSGSEIRIEIYSEASTLFLTLSDNGPGIPDEYISKVFDKFFRVPKGDRHDVKGYGLGLSFAQLVMKQHSGEISVRNIEGGGCKFTLTFPKINK